MKTRSNMPLFVVECTDITKLTDGQIDLLRCGDYLVKKTGKQNHAYKVTYKEDKQGICLTYHDASTVETVSYDYTDGHWVYNSTDKAELPVNGDAPYFEDITDKDGHKRFIEGNIQRQAVEGITLNYGKWSLSGSHLLIVLSLSFASGTVLSNGQNLGYLVLPSWVMSKIVPLFATNVIDRKNFVVYADDYTSQDIAVYLTKATDMLSLTKAGATTLTADRTIRIAFDLLIDNE